MDEEAAKGNILNWDQPEALNLSLFREHLRNLKQGKPVEKPVYDMKVSEPTSIEKIEPKKIIIVEGLFALNDQIVDQADIKAFVDIGTHGRIIRRLLRDIERTGKKPADILAYFAEIVEPMHEQYVQSTMKNADLVINNEYSPEIEAQKSGLHEVQLKFRGDFDGEVLRKLGAERLGRMSQVDHYYNPRDRNLVQTGEILRIREEAGQRILTYKGPKTTSEFRRRPKFEFEIDQETEKKFLSIYGDQIKKVEKQRTLYQLEGVVFSIDTVVTFDGENKKDLGTFLEIRSTDKGADEDKIKTVLAKLGLEVKEGIRESYFEM
jgi:predicted adenylyl cyclase CyaB